MTKKEGIIGLFALVGLWGCSQGTIEEPAGTETPEVKEVAIAFSSDMPEQTSVTRSTTPLEDYYTTFRVWSYKNTAETDGNYTAKQTVIDGYTVSWEENTAHTSLTNEYDWEYVNGSTQQIKFWDFAAKAYRFFAIAPHDATDACALSDSGDSFDVTLQADATDEAATQYFSELWFSNNDAETFPNQRYGQTVTMRFLKPLAKVRFLFVIPPGVPFTRANLDDISFAPTDGSEIQLQGDIKVSYPLTGTSQEYDFTSTPTGVAPDGVLDAMTRDWRAGVDEYWYTVLPRESQDTYTLSVLVVSEMRTAVVPAEYMTWKPGYQYTYVFRITDTGSVVLDLLNIAVHDWMEKSRDYEVYNW